MTGLAWTWKRFEALGVDALYEVLALRARVFVVEQDCPYLDVDGFDRDAWHLLGHDRQGRLQAGLRLLDPGLKYDEPSIGRVTTAPEARGSGFGRALMVEGLAHCSRTWPGRALRIGAQSRLEHFYASLGFVRLGADYLEDGIPHVEMLRPAP